MLRHAEPPEDARQPPSGPQPSYGPIAGPPNAQPQARPHRPTRHDAARAPRGAGPGGVNRLNLLLSSGDWQEETWADLLPRLLAPMGVTAYRVSSGAEAAELIRRMPVHIAVVDLELPLAPEAGDTPDASTTPGSASPSSPRRVPAGAACDLEAGGARLLQLLARLHQPPPTLVVKRRRTRREEARELAAAMSAGAFAVIERPVHMELVLDTMRRVLTRYYRDQWPDGRPPPSSPPPPPSPAGPTGRPAAGEEP